MLRKEKECLRRSDFSRLLFLHADLPNDGSNRWKALLLDATGMQEGGQGNTMAGDF